MSERSHSPGRIRPQLLLLCCIIVLTGCGERNTLVYEPPQPPAADIPDPVTPRLEASPKILRLPADGRETELHLIAEATDWTIRPLAGWITLGIEGDDQTAQPGEGIGGVAGSVTLRVMATANPSATERHTSLLATGREVDAVVVEVVQDPSTTDDPDPDKPDHPDKPADPDNPDRPDTPDNPPSGDQPLSTLTADHAPQLTFATATFAGPAETSDNLRLLQLHLYSDLSQPEVENLMLWLWIDGEACRTGAIEGHYRIATPDMPPSRGGMVAGTLRDVGPDEEALRYEGCWYRLLEHRLQTTRIIRMAPCHSGETTITHDGEHYQLDFRLYDDHPTPYAITGQFEGEIHFTNPGD